MRPIFAAPSALPQPSSGRLAPRAARPAYRDLALEGLRGLCAGAVFLAHLTLPGPAVDPAWAPPAAWRLFDLGFPAVLMFFVLSGYVIGLVTTGPATGGNVRRYAVHRVRRLVPLTTVAVLLSWLLLPQTGGRTVLGNLLFLQNRQAYPWIGAFPLLPNNGNLWSLNYEAVYYAGFVLVWWTRPPLALVLGGLAVLTCAPVPLVFASHACGGLYWVSGLAVAWLAAPAAPIRRTNWIAAGLAAFAIWRTGALRQILLTAELDRWLWPTPVSPHRLDFLPAALWLLLAVTGRAPRLCRALTRGCLALAGFGLAAAVALRGGQTEDALVAVAIAVALAVSRIEYPVTLLERVAPLGALSFGLYVIAGPLEVGQRAIWPAIAGSWETYAIRTVLLAAVTLLLAWWLERRFAPWITGRTRGRKSPTSPGPSAQPVTANLTSD